MSDHLSAIQRLLSGRSAHAVEPCPKTTYRMVFTTTLEVGGLDKDPSELSSTELLKELLEGVQAEIEQGGEGPLDWSVDHYEDSSNERQQWLQKYSGLYDPATGEPLPGTLPGQTNLDELEGDDEQDELDSDDEHSDEPYHDDEDDPYDDDDEPF